MAVPALTDPLVSPLWLRGMLGRPDVKLVDASLVPVSSQRVVEPRPGIKLVDASWHMPAAKRDAKAEFLAKRIPGAVFFDIDAISDPDTDLPHMLPSPQGFAAAVSALGIGSADTVVVYDSSGLFSAARAWWMFRVFGHDAVYVLDGGLPGWIAAGGEVASGEPEAPAPAAFRAQYRADMVRSADDLKTNLETGAEQVLDARAAGRFTGSVPEPRAGLRSGHIPGARNLPFNELLVTETQQMLEGEALRARYLAAGIDLSRPVVTSCGSGVTAAVLALGLHRLGVSDVALYDGSWTEWGGRHDLPLETGDVA